MLNTTSVIFGPTYNILFCIWLRHYATSRKVAGSIPREIIGVFNSSHNMALGSTQTLNRNEYQESL
jgi:hypothetical protein